MTVDDQELRALQFLAARIRKATPGAGVWDDAGFAANLGKLRHWNLHLLVEHVIRHAADPAAKTPGVLAGPYTPPGPAQAAVVKRGNPTRAEECRFHPGQWPETCAGCNTERYARTPDDVSPDLPKVEDVSPGLAKRLADRLGGN